MPQEGMFRAHTKKPKTVLSDKTHAPTPPHKNQHAQAPMQGLQMGLAHTPQGMPKKAARPQDPILGLMDALKAEQIMALAQKVAEGVS